MKNRFLVVLLAMVLLTSCSAYPSDQVLMDKLRIIEAQFNRLVSMFKEDSSLLEVNGEFALSTWDTRVELPSARAKEYRRLLSSLQLGSVGRWGSHMIYMKAWHRSAFPFGGSTKFYVYAESQPERIVDSIDRIERGGQDASVFMKIKDNWYLHWDVW